MSGAAAASLDEIVKYAQGAFVNAKSDGKLEAGEVVQIAVTVAAKLRALGQLSGSDKKSVVLYCLKKGLDAAGGIGELPGLKELPAEARKAVEEQLLAAAGAAIDVAVAAARGKIDLRKDGVKACLPLCLSAAAVAKVLIPKDQVLLKQALEFAEAQAASQVAAPPAPPASTDTSPAKEPEKGSSPAASPEAPPEPAAAPAPAPVASHEVKFE